MSEVPSIGGVKKGLKSVHEEAEKTVTGAEQTLEAAGEAQISARLCLEALEEAKRHASEMLGYAATALAASGNTAAHAQSAQELLARHIIGTGQSQTGETSLLQAQDAQKKVGGALRSTIGTFPESSIGFRTPEAVIGEWITVLNRVIEYAEESKDAALRGEDEVFVTDENL
jgi:hypothetical protein